MNSESLPLLRPLPDRIETTRLILRPWSAADAPVLKALIDANLDHLRAWMPWAMNEPSPVEAIAERVEVFAGNVRDGTDFGVGVFLGDEAIGGAGLHRRNGPDTLEIGYWTASAHTGRGYASEAAMALTSLAFTLPHIEHVQIRCDPHNTSSAAVPRKLGFSHVATLEADTLTPTGEPRATMVWQVSRTQWRTKLHDGNERQEMSAPPRNPPLARQRERCSATLLRRLPIAQPRPAAAPRTVSPTFAPHPTLARPARLSRTWAT